MAVKDSATEQLIKDTAKKVFFCEGRFNATTQDIANAAGVNRTLLNYYFRSRDILFAQVLEEAMEAMDKRMENIFLSNLSFKTKIENFIDVFSAEGIEYPYLDSYMITRINQVSLNQVCGDFTIVNAKLTIFLKEVETEIKKGNIIKMPPAHFFLNMMSLIAHPLCMQTLFKKVLNQSDTAYKKTIKERKQFIIKALFIQ